MKPIDRFSYELGAADCFCEMVRAGVKRLALAHPCDSPQERDQYLPYFEELCRKYGVKLYVEDEAFLKDLFPLSLNQGKYNALFYQEDSALQEYLALKAEKRAAVEKLARKYFPADTPEHREQFIRRDWAPLCMLEMTVEHLSGKQAVELIRPQP